MARRPPWSTSSGAAWSASPTRPRLLLATALAEHTDAALSAELGCDVATVLRLRLCYPPRADRWAADVATIAAALDCDPAVLAALLDRVGVGPPDTQS